MTRSSTGTDVSGTDEGALATDQAVAQELKPPAEVRFAHELEALAKRDVGLERAVPPGWNLSPKAVREFIVGHEEAGATRKFYGDDPLVDRAITQR